MLDNAPPPASGGPSNSSRMRRPGKPVVPVPAPGQQSYMPASKRNIYAQSVEQYEDLRSPSPTPSARVGKPVSPIPTILVERPVSTHLPFSLFIAETKPIIFWL